MESTRQQKVARLIQKELSQIFIREGSWLYGRVLVSITVVRVSPDLSVAKIYLSIYGTTNKNKVLQTLEQHKPKIRYWLGQQLKNQLRIVPELIFYLDDSVDYAEKMEEVFKKIHENDRPSDEESAS
jgi:ribosome-binding factor A